MGRTRKLAPEPPIALDRIRWKDEQSFRMLSYYFSVRWNVDKGGEYVRHVLGDFAVPKDPDEYNHIWAPGLPPLYSIVKVRSDISPYRLLYGDGLMLQAAKLDDILPHLVFHVHSQVARQTGDFLLIHAGAVSTQSGEGVLLPAPSGNGKTTLVTGLVRAGYLYMSDEMGAIDPVSRQLYPFQRALGLKGGHETVFPELYRGANRKAPAGAGMCHARPEAVRDGARGGPCRIRFVVAHRYEAGATTEITPITPAQAAMELLTNTMNLPRYRARALPLVADVARRARSYRLVSGNLDEAVEAISEVTRRRRRTAGAS